MSPAPTIAPAGPLSVPTTSPTAVQPTGPPWQRWRRHLSALKRRLADPYADDADASIAGEDAFVKHQEAAALAWQAASKNNT